MTMVEMVQRELSCAQRKAGHYREQIDTAVADATRAAATDCGGMTPGIGLAHAALKIAGLRAKYDAAGELVDLFACLLREADDAPGKTADEQQLLNRAGGQPMRTAFTCKPNTLENVTQSPREHKSEYYIASERHLTQNQWMAFTNNLLGSYEWIVDFTEKRHPHIDGVRPCLRVTTDGNPTALIIDTQGYNYARYVGYEPQDALK